MRFGQISSFAGSQNSLFVNIYTGLTMAFSLRRISKTYGGRCIRVRRSSDNATLDIGFSGDELDTTTLMSFVGGGDGLVSVWYDQSGNNNNIAQSTLTRQAAIVSGGTMITKNGKPALQLQQSANQTYTITTSTFQDLVFDLYSVISISSGTSFATYSLISIIGSGSRVWGLTDGINEVNIGIDSAVVQGSGTSAFFQAVPMADNIQKLVNLYNDNVDTSYATYNNSRIFSAQTFAPAPITSGSKSCTLFSIDGTAQEFLFFSGGNQTINKNAIKNNLTSYYSLGSDYLATLPHSQPFGLEGESLFTPGTYLFPRSWLPNDTSDINCLLLTDYSYPVCDVPGSSGGISMVFLNAMGITAEVITRPVSTLNKTNIQVQWNEMINVGSAQLLALEWSTDYVTWNSLSITEPVADDTWYANGPFTLPVGAENQETLYFKIIHNGDASGFFTAIDDFTVSGT